jgi:hypothetical protein
MIRKSAIYLFFSLLINSVASSTVASDSPTMSLCTTAIANGEAYLEAKHQIALQRKDAGSLSEQNYQNEVQSLAAHAQWLPLDMCMASLGEQVTLYQCLFDQAGNFALCSQ